MDVPETRYASAADGVQIAYQRFGSGSVDLVYMPFFVFNLDLYWDFEPVARWLRGLGSFARVLIHDPRGTGLSDRGAEPGDLGTRAGDLLAVMDHAGIDRTAVMAARSVGGVGVFLGASHPERVSSFVWLNAVARDAWSPDYPWGEEVDALEADILASATGWGSTEDAEQTAAAEGPMGAVDPDFRRWMGRMLRNSVTPARAEALLRTWYATDVRDVLPTLSVPTLVLAREVTAEESRAVARMIPGAAIEVFAGADMMPWFGDSEALLESIRRFLGAERTAVRGDRFLATVLFTDIVDSTARAAAMGDARWRVLVEDHHRLIRSLLARHGGAEMDTAGDGFYASFAAPGDAARCALEACEAVRHLGLEIRAGIHTGEVHLADGKYGGLAVAIGARVSAKAGPSEVLASQTVKDLTAGSGLVFEDTGEHDLKGIPERWRLYRVVG